MPMPISWDNVPRTSADHQRAVARRDRLEGMAARTKNESRELASVNAWLAAYAIHANPEKFGQGILHRHENGTEHRHFSAGFEIGGQVIPDNDGTEEHQHGVLMDGELAEPSGPVIWREDNG